MNNIKDIIKSNEKEFEERFPNELYAITEVFNKPFLAEPKKEKIKSHLHQSQLKLLEGVREMIERFKVAKPRSKEEEVIHDIKKAWLEETKSALLSLLDNK